MLFQKIKKISERHQRSIPVSVVYEGFIRLYRVPGFRRVARKFFKTKQPQQWIFVVGCYNAGTTVVKDAIALHPSISTLPIEGDLLTDEMSNLEEGGWARCLYGNKEEILSRKRKSALNISTILKDWAPWIRAETIFMDKAISHSCRIDQLRSTFGVNTKFVVITRNKQNVVSGIQRRSAPSGAAKEQLGSSEYPEALLNEQWDFMYNLIATDAKLSDTFVISYEDFLENPESVTLGAYKFLGLADPGLSYVSGSLQADNRTLPVRLGKAQNNERISSLEQLFNVVGSAA